jgi:hypothetical protein
VGLNKFLIVILFMVSNIFANCPDFALAEVGTTTMKTNFTKDDSLLSNELDSIINHINENIKKDTSDLKISFDLKNLSVDSLLELKEIEAIIDKSNKIIFKQR